MKSEEIILSQIIKKPSILNELLLTPEHFINKTNRIIYMQIHNLVKDGIQPTLCALHDKLKDVPASYLASITDNHGLGEWKYHEKCIIENFKKVKLDRLKLHIDDWIKVDGSDVVIQKIHDSLNELNDPVKRKIETISELLPEWIELTEDRYKNRGTLPGINWGIKKLNDYTMGALERKLYYIGARPSQGKEQPLSAKLITPNGVTTMGEIKISDDIIGADGKPYKIIGKYLQGEKDIYRITFDDNTWAECGLDHLWEIKSREERKRNKNASIMALREIIDTNLYLKDGRRNYSVKLNKPVMFNKKIQELSPYLLGIYLGDGDSSGGVRITNSEKDIIKKISLLLPTTDKLSSNKNSHRIVRKKRNNKPSDTKKIINKLGLLGKLSYNKFIPNNYLYGDILQRIELLKGLLDSDGYVSFNSNIIEYSTTSKDLMEGVIFLVQSLGGKATYIKRMGSYRKNNEIIYTRINYRIYIKFNGLIPFSSKKHLKKYKNTNKRGKKYIDSITFKRKEQAACILINSEDHLYLTNNFIVTHNTAFSLNLACNIAFREKLPVGFISLESANKELVTRIMSSETEINSQNLTMGYIKKIEFDRILSVCEKISNTKLYFYDKPNMRLNEICITIRRMVNDLNCKIIFIDYLQLIRYIDTNMSIREKTNIVSMTLKELARNLNIPVVCLAQLRRDVDNRVPGIGDFKESSQIEQDADVAMLLHHEYDDDMKIKSSFIKIAKCRDGITGIIPIKFEREFVKFKEVNYG